MGIRRVLQLLIGCALPFGNDGRAQTPPPQTPNVGLYLPAQGLMNWGTWVNANWNRLDTVIGSTASSFAGADCGAQINAAYAALPSAGGRIFVNASCSFAT